MILKTPRRLPALADMIRDLSATPDQIATALDVHRSTVYLWLRNGYAPRPAMLALYWMTRWGLSEIDAELWNAASVYRGLSQALERELWQVTQHIQQLDQLGDFGSANDPVSGLRSRYGLDGAATFQPVEGDTLATRSQAGSGRGFEAHRR